MKIPVIFTASSASQQAQSTYKKLEEHILKALPDADRNRFEFHWGYNRRVVNRERAKGTARPLPEIAHIAEQLIKQGHSHAILQSLHLIVGHEFHQLHHESSRINKLTWTLGKPLLTSPDDFTEFMEILTDLETAYPDHALLLIGHGTRHASWPIYLGIEHIMQRHFGRRAYLGVVEHYPDSSDVEKRITSDGHTKVVVIPFFLTAGVHFQRDVAGSADSSWRSRLTRAGLEVEIAWEHGLAELPAVAGIYARHIMEASTFSG